MSLRTLLRNERVPSSIKFAFRDCAAPDTAEQELWREVVARAVLDAMGIVESSKEDQASIKESREWFRKYPETVVLVFEVAGVQLAPVLEGLKECIGKEQSHVVAERPKVVQTGRGRARNSKKGARRRARPAGRKRGA